MAGRLNEGDDSKRVLAAEGEQAVDVAPRPRFCIVSPSTIEFACSLSILWMLCIQFKDPSGSISTEKIGC